MSKVTEQNTPRSDVFIPVTLCALQNEYAAALTIKSFQRQASMIKLLFPTELSAEGRFYHLVENMAEILLPSLCVGTAVV